MSYFLESAIIVTRAFPEARCFKLFSFFSSSNFHGALGFHTSCSDLG